MGKELYSYFKKEDDIHKDMHSLDGAFIKKGEPEQFGVDGIMIYPFKIIFPNN